MKRWDKTDKVITLREALDLGGVIVKPGKLDQFGNYFTKEAIEEDFKAWNLRDFKSHTPTKPLRFYGEKPHQTDHAWEIQSKDEQLLDELWGYGDFYNTTPIRPKKVKPTIKLWPDENEIYLIYLCDSGVEYTAQTNGFSCNHPSVEGVLIPLHNEFYASLNLSGFCCSTDDFEDTQIHEDINSSIASSEFEYFFGFRMKVDSLSLHPIEEAWVPVTLERVGEPWLDTFEGFPDKFQGILVWQNCD